MTWLTPPLGGFKPHSLMSELRGIMGFVQKEMKPIHALGAIAVGLILIMAGFAQSNSPGSDVSVGTLVVGLVVMGAGLIGLGRASS